ncbi:hypothetical protein V8C86DRAFT_3107954 [Haematococcus lacustris]
MGDEEFDHPDKLDSKWLANKEKCHAAFAGLITLHLRREAALDLDRGFWPGMERRGAQLPPLVPEGCMFAQDMRIDVSFNLAVRLRDALDLAEPLRSDAEANKEDLRLAAALVALFSAWESNRANVLSAAGALAKATHVILQRRDRMLERHVLPDVVNDMKIKALVDIGNVYKSAWIDNELDALRKDHPALLAECLDRAVADTTVGDARGRLELRLAMANRPPSRRLLKEVTARVWAAGNGRQRVPYCTTLAPQQPSFEEVWEAMKEAEEEGGSSRGMGVGRAAEAGPSGSGNRGTNLGGNVSGRGVVRGREADAVEEDEDVHPAHGRKRVNPAAARRQLMDMDVEDADRDRARAARHRRAVA